MKEAFTKIKEAIANIHRVVKTDEDLEWNRAIYKCSTIVSEVEAEFENDVCEYEEHIAPSKEFYYLTACKNRWNGRLHGCRPYCPYCGKKIKVVE